MNTATRSLVTAGLLLLSAFTASAREELRIDDVEVDKVKDPEGLACFHVKIIVAQDVKKHIADVSLHFVVEDNGTMYYGTTRNRGWWYWDLGGKDIESHWAFLIPIDKMRNPKAHSYYVQLHSKAGGEVVDEEKHRVKSASLDQWTAEYKDAKPLEFIQVDPFDKFK